MTQTLPRKTTASKVMVSRAFTINPGRKVERLMSALYEWQQYDGRAYSRDELDSLLIALGRAVRFSSNDCPNQRFRHEHSIVNYRSLSQRTATPGQRVI